MNQHDPRVSAARLHPVDQVLSRLALAKLATCGHERTGPCPKCGGTDRFSVNIRTSAFLCRHCLPSGGFGVIGLVMHCLSTDFLGAVEWLEGPPDKGVSQEELARRERAAAEAREKSQMEERAYRARARQDAHRIWSSARDPSDTDVETYLARRGVGEILRPYAPRALRYVHELPYMWRPAGGEWAEIHRGPAMVAAIQGPKGGFIGAHRTWIDPRPGKTKARIVATDGTVQKSKKSLGSVRGGAIRLKEVPRADTMVMAEGIETTASAMVSGAFKGAAFWCGVSLGNMAGRAVRGKDLKYRGIPDLTDDRAFVPPTGIKRLIFIQDGDSDPRDTRAKLLTGARRAMALRPGLTAKIVSARDGMDLNDMLLAVEAAEDVDAE